MLKLLLLNSDEFLDNIYLDKYCILIESNLWREAEKFKTNLHHIIPASYYKYKNLEINNSKENLVNLLYKDHILAHYYLCLCLKDSELKYKLISAFCRMIKQKSKYILAKDERLLIENLDYYQELYEINCIKISERNKGRKVSAESIKKQLETKKKNNTSKHSEATKAKMRHPHIMTNKPKKPMSEEHRQKISISKQSCGNGHSGKKYINNGKECFCILPEDFKYWEEKGFTWGRLTSDLARQSYMKKVRCIELNKVYNSLSEAAADLNLSISKISCCCNGTRKTTGGYHWEFVSKE